VQTYVFGTGTGRTFCFVVCAGRMLSQPDARRSSVIEEKVLIMG
jgi:hypothetical protein